MMRKHWNRWFGQPIPMLGNKTSREVAKIQYERQDQESSNNIKIDIECLR